MGKSFQRFFNEKILLRLSRGRATKHINWRGRRKSFLMTEKSAEKHYTTWTNCIKRYTPFVLAFVLSFPLQNLTYPLSLSLSLLWLLTRIERRGCHVVPLLAGCPRGLSALSTSAAGLFSGKKKSSDSYLDTLKSSDFYMRKEKLRLISRHFEKFELISDKKKVRTHIWYI